MVAKKVTRRTATKNIRFPHRLIEDIKGVLEREGSSNFSAWVLNACAQQVKLRQSKQEELDCSKWVTPEPNYDGYVD